MGFRKCSMKILASILTFMMVCSAIFTDSVISSIQLAYADQGVKDAQPAEEAEAALEEESQDTNMWYNPNSSMRDFRDETIYFVMTTRFFDGDPSNNVQSWEGTSYNGDETPWKGDFKGLIDKLDYIKALGFTAIWITPIVKNASGYDYHGYHAINFKEVDSRYESDDCTYQDLIDAVHARGMKIIQDVVFNHTGNFGEENLLNLFSRDDNANLAEITECMIPNPAFFPMDYFSLDPELQYQMRLDYMKDLQGTGKDEKNLWHHFGEFNWDNYTCQLAQIAGDCVDLNTENPIVYKYLVEAYGQYIKMGVDAFRVDTVRHMSRLSLNNGFISQLNDIYNDVHGTTGERNFYMFGEVCTRYSSVWYREVPALSTPFYTWKESKVYPWIDDENDLKAYETNMASAEAHYNDNGTAKDIAKQPTSDNAFLNGNEYHTPDYSMSSGLDVIDFPMHWNFKEAEGAYNIAISSDKWYNDATYNVVYVDSHDYAPDHAPEDERYAGSQEQWAENLSLMFTFRGIPCIYYGSEVEFMKGAVIDIGPYIAINDTGRAYFGDYIEGSVDVVDFARYTNATGTMKDTLNHPLSLHIQRLNRLRASVPALRKGQYSTEGCKGKFAYKRRYTDSTTDSFALIALTSDAEFTGIPNGKYTDAITGDVKNVTDGTLSTSGINGKGDLRVYVLDTALTKAPGLIEGHSDYMSGEGGDVRVDTIKPTGITMTGETTATIDLGETCTFTAEVSPADATNKIVTWSSSDTSVATVSGNGKVTGKGEGTATIYAATCNAESADYTNNSGLVATAQVTVKASGIKVTSIVLSKNAVTLEEGKAEKITTTIVPGNASPNYAVLTWSSADTSVAKVSSNGIITAVKAGKTTITVSTASGVSATIDVQVKGAEVHGNAIYFKKPSGWGNKVYAYLWAKDAAGTVTWKNKAWPGETMILTDEKEGIYGVSWPDGQTDINVVFSDGSNQTDDLKPVMNACIDNVGNIVKDEIPTNAENEKTGKVIVQYVDESGNEIAQSKVLTGTVGVVYTTTAVMVEGYTLKSSPDNATGVYAETDTTVTYVYQKSTTPTPEKKGKVIVRYADESDNEIKTSKTLTGIVGADYETAEANIAGYTLKTSPENAKGKYTEADITVTYVYQKNDINEKTGKVIVRYVDESDKEIKTSTTLTGIVGADYETEEAEIEGYTLKTNPENAKGKYTEADITVTYVYQKNQVTEKIGKVIVRYVDESDKEIKASTTLTGTVGADYETAEAKIEGYTLKTSPVNAKGKYTEADITVTYVYQKNDINEKTGKVIVRYVDESDKEIKASTTLTGTVGANYETAEAKIEGYTLKTSPANAKGKYTEEDITVTYVYQKNTTPEYEKVSITSFKMSKASNSITTGQAVRMTANATGGGGALKYQFVVKLGNGKNQAVRKYSSDNSCQWIPTQSGKYTLYVYVKDSSTGKVVKKSIKNYNVKPALKIKSFTQSRKSGTAVVGDKVIVRVNATGGIGKKTYKYYYKFNGKKYVLKENTTSKKVNWIPKKAGKYQLFVEVTDDMDNKITKKVNYVVADKLKVKSLKASASSVEAGQEVKLSAAAAGGTKGYSYKFTYEYKNKSVTINNYSGSSSVMWTPKYSGKYKITVYVRDAKNRKATKTITLNVK